MNPATRLMVGKLKEMAERGLTYQQAADELQAGYHCIAHYARRYDIPLRQLPRGPKSKAQPGEREIAMRDLYVSGQTLEQIGQKNGIARERVRQLLVKYFGIRSKDGGQSKQVRDKRAAFQKKRDARCQRSWGCNYKQYQAILKHPDKPTYAFSQQRKNAQERGIGWELSLWQWWKAWEQSGHWSERGRGRAYGMCRLNDSGPYAIDNIYIGTGVENMQDYWANKRAQSVMQETVQ